MTNTSAQSALRILGATQRSLAATQGQMATGLRVAGAKDDAAVWSIATTMSTRIGKLKSVNDGLDLTSAVISTANAALTNILGMTQKMANLVVAAQTSGIDIAAAQSQIADLQTGVISAAESATFNGVNWLVTRVVGTQTSVRTNTSDATYAYSRGLDSGMDGVENSAETYVYHEDVTRTLGSTSASRADTANSATYTTTSTTIAGVHSRTVAINSQTSTTSASSDPTNYRFGRIVTSLNTDGSVQSSMPDFHATELFQSFSGTSFASNQETFIDYSYTTSAGGPMMGQAPYLTGTQDDVLDTAFTATSGQTNILQMVLRNASDAAAAAPAIDTALTRIADAMTFLGGLQNQVDGSKQINAAIIDALTSGVGSLVDTDMDHTSVRLAALQTQEQLGIESLSIANDNGQIILKLFGG